MDELLKKEGWDQAAMFDESGRVLASTFSATKDDVTLREGTYYCAFGGGGGGQ
jgi:hypothetical protein